MKDNLLSRSHLETLSTADLIALADGYGVDIPDSLSRRFIIGELLEIAEELEQDYTDDLNFDDSQVAVHSEEQTLPETYNETMICAILRNPAWVYVYWDISASELNRLKGSRDFDCVMLRASFFSKKESNSPTEFFDIQIALSDRQQYVLLPSGAEKKFMRVDLVAKFKDNSENLAITEKIALSKGAEILSEALPGRELHISRIMELSGMRDLLKLHYENHRQSFS